METKYGLKDYFSDVETKREHNGYWCNVWEALTIGLHRHYSKFACFTAETVRGCGVGNEKIAIEKYFA